MPRLRQFRLGIVLLMLLTPGAQVVAEQSSLDAELLTHPGIGDVEKVTGVRDHGASPHAVHPGGGPTPLAQAADDGHLEVMRALIGQGADVNAKDKIWGSALAKAAMSGQSEAVKLLLDAGAEPDPKALSIACLFDREAVAKQLLAAGAEPDAGMPAAAARGDLSLLQLLLEHGAKPDAGLAAAAHGGRLHIVQLLLERGADINAASPGGNTALHQAAHAGRNEIVQFLLERGADLHAVTDKGDTPLHRALANDPDLATINQLVAVGAKLDIPNKDGVTPVRLAGIRGGKLIYDWLVEQNGGAEPYPAIPPAEQKQSLVIEETIRDLSSKQRPVRDAAMRRLALHQKVAMPQVLKAIEAGGPFERYMEALPAMGPEAQAAIPLLAARLSDEKQALGLLITINRIKPGASEELPENQKQAAAASLYEIIADPGSDVMGGFASQLLPSLGASAVPTILRLLEHDNPRIRAGIPRDVYRSDLRDDRINAAISRMAHADADASVRTKAAEALTVLGIKDERPRAELFAIIKRPPPHTGRQLTDQQKSDNDHAAADRKAAASALVAFGPGIIDDLVPLLTPLDHHERYAAMTILERLGPPAIPRLVELLSHDDQAVAISASVALYRMRRPAVPALVEVLKSADDQAVIHSCSALWWIKGGAKAAKPALLQVAVDKSRSDAVRLAAVRAVQKIDPGASKSPEVLSTLPLLRGLLDKGDFVQQGQAAAALGEIGPAARDALPLLRKRLALPAEGVDTKGYVRDYVQREARAAIESITGSSPQQP